MTDLDDLTQTMHDFIDDGGSIEELLDKAREVADAREADDMVEDDPEDYS